MFLQKTLVYLCLFASVWAAEASDPFLLRDQLTTGFNNQILIEYEAFYVYENMAVYFARPDVGLLGFAKFFRQAADEEVDHARKFTDFINKRNGRVILQHIMPTTENLPKVFRSVKEAIQLSIQKELSVSTSVIMLHKHASEMKDAHAQDFLDGFLIEQVESVSKLRTLASRLELSESATFLIDKELL